MFVKSAVKPSKVRIFYYLIAKQWSLRNINKNICTSLHNFIKNFPWDKIRNVVHTIIQQTPSVALEYLNDMTEGSYKNTEFVGDNGVHDALSKTVDNRRPMAT